MSEEAQNSQSPPDSSQQPDTSQDQNAAFSAGQLKQVSSQKAVNKVFNVSGDLNNELWSNPNYPPRQPPRLIPSGSYQGTNQLQKQVDPPPGFSRVSALPDWCSSSQLAQRLGGLSCQFTTQPQTITDAATNLPYKRVDPPPGFSRVGALLFIPSIQGPNPISFNTNMNASSTFMMDDLDYLQYDEKIANFNEENKQPDGRYQDDFNGVEVSLSDENENDDCPICLGPFKENGPIKGTGACCHVFHAKCLEDSLKQDFKCAVCRAVIKKKLGPCPNGYMYITAHKDLHCAGYENCGTIVIRYALRGGVQGPQHPNPGVRFYPDQRTAFLPDNEAGKEVLKLLKKAWEMKLTFQIGTSISTGATNVITWNDIHHKTSLYGGSANYGYPDVTYLVRVTADMHALGVRLDE